MIILSFISLWLLIGLLSSFLFMYFKLEIRDGWTSFRVVDDYNSFLIISFTGPIFFCFWFIIYLLQNGCSLILKVQSKIIDFVKVSFKPVYDSFEKICNKGNDNV